MLISKLDKTLLQRKNNTYFKASANENIPEVPAENKIIPTEANGGQSGITNIFGLKNGIYQATPDNKVNINSGEAGFYDSQNREILYIRDNNYWKETLKLDFAKGKDGTAVIIRKPGKFKAVVLNGVINNNNGFEVRMSSSSHKTPGFQGNFYPVMAYMPEASIEALDSNWNEIQKLSKTDKIKEQITSEPELKNWNIIATIGGFGTRVAKLLSKDSNKPALNTPGGIPILAYSMIAAQKSGLELPQNFNRKHCVIEDDIKVGTAGGVVEGMKKNIISIQEPSLIIPGDSIIDMNLKPILKEFNNDDTAGALIIGKGFPKSKINGLGIIGTDNNGIVTSFIEKPKKPELAEEGLIKNTEGIAVQNNGVNQYLANIATYAFKPPLLKALLTLEPMAREGNLDSKYNNDNLERNSDGKEFDFGKHALPTLQVLCNADIMTSDNTKIDREKFQQVANNIKDEKHPIKRMLKNKGIEDTVYNLNSVIDVLKDKNGERLKLVAREAKGDWADVGTYDALFETFTAIADDKGFKTLPPPAIAKTKENVSKDGVIYIPAKGKTQEEQNAPKKAFMEFLGKNGTARGNIVVMPDDGI